jgi:L-ectoine synthase
MKIRRTKDLIGTKKDVEFTGGNSIRLILEKDNMGFSFHETHVKKGKWHWHYKNHKESCFCISGHGFIHNLEDGKSYEVKPGTIYILDKHDNHEFEALENTILLSVFNPPIVGDESHDKNGNYELKNKSKRDKAIEIVNEVVNSYSNYDAIEKVENLI